MSQGSYTVLQLDAADVEKRTEAVKKFNDEMARLSGPAAKLLGQCWEHDHEELRRKSMRKHVFVLLFASFCWLLGVVFLSGMLAGVIKDHFGPPIGASAHLLLGAFLLCSALLPGVLLLISLRRED